MASLKVVLVIFLTTIALPLAHTYVVPGYLLVDDEQFLFMSQDYQPIPDDQLIFDSSGQHDIYDYDEMFDETADEKGLLDWRATNDIEDEQMDPFSKENTHNIFAFHEMSTLQQMVRRYPGIATANSLKTGGAKSAEASKLADPNTCLPSRCFRFNSDIEHALQYLSNQNAGPTFTNLLFSACHSSRLLDKCLTDNMEEDSKCDDSLNHLTLSAVQMRHSHLCNETMLLGQCVQAIEISVAHRHCVVTALTNTAKEKTTDTGPDKLDLCSALDRFIHCVFQVCYILQKKILVHSD